MAYSKIVVKRKAQNSNHLKLLEVTSEFTV